VKRLGDGVLVTFEGPQTALRFIELVGSNSKMQAYPCKIAADIGDVYLFKFENNLKDDPYGPVVDRCARILDLARPSLPLFGEGFVEASPDKSGFHFALDFPFKGFPRPQKVFIRSPQTTTQAINYLKPLLAALNDKKTRRPRYRYIARRFTEKDFALLHSGPRPFLLGELINVPKLPYSYGEFSSHMETLTNDEEFYDFYGMLVEWECCFRSYGRIGDDEIVAYTGDGDYRGPSVQLHVKGSSPEF
jgi:hypothetical protein